MEDNNDDALRAELLDDLALLKKHLGNKYRKLKPDTTKQNRKASSLREEINDLAAVIGQPSSSVVQQRQQQTANLANTAKSALEANKALQARLHQLLKSITIAQDKNTNIRARVRETVRRKQTTHGPMPNSLNTPDNSSLLGLRSQLGGSWFFTVPGAPPPPANADTYDIATVTRVLPLVLKRSSWLEEERGRLSAGVLQLVQEKQLSVLMEGMELKVRQGGSVSVEEYKEQQKPIENLKIDAPEVIATSFQFTDYDWNTIALRSLPGRSGIDCKLQWLHVTRPDIRVDPFTPDEDAQLLDLVDQYGDRKWKIIAQSIGGHRTPLQCMGRYQQLLLSQKETREFTDEDLSRLEALVKVHGQHWKRIAEEFGGGWESTKLIHFWRRYEQRRDADVGPRKGKWTVEEDEALRKAVALKGKKWAEVARLVPGRTDVQCRERFSNVLDPAINTKPWTPQELSSLRKLVPEHTNQETGKVKWSLVASSLPGRTDNMCAKRWKRLQRPTGLVKSPTSRTQTTTARRKTPLRAQNNDSDDDAYEDEPGPSVRKRNVGSAAAKTGHKGRKGAVAKQEEEEEEVGEAEQDDDTELAPTRGGRKRQKPSWMGETVQ